MSLFFPKQDDFFADFDKLNEHLHSMVGLFSEFVKDFKDFETYSKKAGEIEHLGDAQTHMIIEKLNKSFITPFDREDIYRLSQELDDIIDLVEDVINNVRLYKITSKFNGLDEFSNLMTDASVEMGKMLGELRKLKLSDELSQVKIRIHKLEDKADTIFENSIQELFSKEMNPINLIKQKDVLEGMENVMDKFQSVCDIIEGIVLKIG